MTLFATLTDLSIRFARSDVWMSHFVREVQQILEPMGEDSLFGKTEHNREATDREACFSCARQRRRFLLHARRSIWDTAKCFPGITAAAPWPCARSQLAEFRSQRSRVIQLLVGHGDLG